jgi:hypothetical protein
MSFDMIAFNTSSLLTDAFSSVFTLLQWLHLSSAPPPIIAATVALLPNSATLVGNAPNG